MRNYKHKKKNNAIPLILGFTTGVFAAILLLFLARVIYSKGQIVCSTLNSLNLKKAGYYLLQKKSDILSSFQKAVNSFEDKKIPDFLEFTIDSAKLLHPINPLIYGSNLSAKTEFEMDAAKFSKDIGITSFRFPGGGSEGFHWKTGKYDFSDRFDNAPLSEITNLIQFCKIAGAKLVIQVNVESGTPQEAAEWVEYMNKGKGMRVDYWELGNEVYGDWDRGFMTGEEYAQKIKEYSTLMKTVDPTIKIGANWGDPKYKSFNIAMIKNAADYIDFVTYHWYPNHINREHAYKGRTHPTAKEIMANSLAVSSIVKRFKHILQKYAPYRKDSIELAFLEWDGSWDAVPSNPNNETKGMMWSLANAIFYCDTLGQFAKYKIKLAHQFTFQEVMFGLIPGWDRDAGWGGIPWDRKTIRPKALAMKLFARYFGNVLVESHLSGSPSYLKTHDVWPDSYSGKVPYVSGYASRFLNSNLLAIVLINKHQKEDFPVKISLRETSPQEKGFALILNGPSLESQNDGNPETVRLNRITLENVKEEFMYTVPAHSVSLIQIELTEAVSK